MRLSHSARLLPEMIVRTRTYRYARANLANLRNELEDHRASVRIQRPGLRIWHSL